MKVSILGACLITFIFSICSFLLIAADFPTDEQIAKILITTNDGEISMARLAEESAESKDIKKFAKHMIIAHQKNNRKTMKLSKKLNLVPEGTDKTVELQREADINVATLKGLKGKAFDKAFIDMQIADHQKVLGELDNNLIPAAKNEKLKKELEKTRKVVAGHLEDAKKVQAKLTL